MSINSHNPDDPQSLMNKLDATMEAVHTRCEFCDLDVEVVPASGTRYVLGTTHEPGCPERVEE